MERSGLIVGLGNPGQQYQRTRHNLGFMAVEALLAWGEEELGVQVARRKNDAKHTLWELAAPSPVGRWLVLTPLTYMNRSGDAVAPVCSFYKIPADRMLVLHDELDLPLGRMKLKFGGGLAGHNGLKSIAERLGTREFHRLRLGIGKPGQSGTTNHVLGRFSSQEETLVEDLLAVALKGLCAFMGGDAQTAQQDLNSYRPLLVGDEKGS